MSRTKTAYHEAGHAVAFHRLFPEGRLGLDVTIVPNPDRGTTGSHSAEELFDCGDEEIEAEAVYSCAGYAALIAAGFPAKVAKEGCESDFECAEQCSSRPLDHIQQEAVALLSRPENRRAVECVVTELLRRETLDWDLVVNLLNLVDGKTTEAEYQQYLTLRDDG